MLFCAAACLVPAGYKHGCDVPGRINLQFLRLISALPRAANAMVVNAREVERLPNGHLESGERKHAGFLRSA